MKYHPTFDFDSPRQERVLAALIENRYIWRESVDRTAKASNGPQVILELRRRGWRIGCRRIEKIDIDGKRCWPGLYWLHPNHKLKAMEALERDATRSSGSSSKAGKQENPKNGF